MKRFAISLFLFGLFLSCGPKKDSPASHNRPAETASVPHKESETSEADLRHEQVCTAVAEKMQNASSEKVLTLSEDDFAISSGGTPINAIFKRKVPKAFFEQQAGLRIKFNVQNSQISDFSPQSRSLWFAAGRVLEFLDKCYSSYSKSESSLSFFFQEASILDKLSSTEDLLHRDIMFRFINKNGRALNVFFPVDNLNE